MVKISSNLRNIFFQMPKRSQIVKKSYKRTLIWSLMAIKGKISVIVSFNILKIKIWKKLIIWSIFRLKDFIYIYNMVDSPANNAKITDVNGAFQTISSQIESENIYDTSLNGSPKKQNSQSTCNRVSHYGRIFRLFHNYKEDDFFIDF